VPFYGSKLRKNWLVRLKFSSREMSQATKKAEHAAMGGLPVRNDK
jgi:hypothetical protein